MNVAAVLKLKKKLNDEEWDADTIIWRPRSFKFEVSEIVCSTYSGFLILENVSFSAMVLPNIERHIETRLIETRLHHRHSKLSNSITIPRKSFHTIIQNQQNFE